MDQGASFIAILDRRGMAAVKQRIPEAITIGITVGSIEVLKRRLSLRDTESNEHFDQRILLAEQEMSILKKKMSHYMSF